MTKRVKWFADILPYTTSKPLVICIVVQWNMYYLVKDMSGVAQKSRFANKALMIPRNKSIEINKEIIKAISKDQNTKRTDRNT